MRNIFLLGLLLIVFGCNRNSSNGYITVKVKEVEQVGTYTYLLVKEKGPEYWIAVSSIVAIPGETYHYQGGLLMQNFYSKDLDRTFDKVLFLDNIISDKSSPNEVPEEVTPGSMVSVEKSDVDIEIVEGTISIADLFSNPESFEGEKIRIRGEVTKYNGAIMDRNWVHIQDGTEFEGKFDLTATSAESYVIGSTVTLEGIVALNLDFGYGYSYEILLEKATAVK